MSLFIIDIFKFYISPWFRFGRFIFPNICPFPLYILICWYIIAYAEKAMAPHSSTLAWKIPWMEEPGRLQSMGSLRVEHDWATSLSLFTFMHWRRNGNPLQCSCLENPRDGEAWWAAAYGVTQSRTRLKWLSEWVRYLKCFLLLLLSRFSCVQLCATP